MLENCKLGSALFLFCFFRLFALAMSIMKQAPTFELKKQHVKLCNIHFHNGYE